MKTVVLLLLAAAALSAKVSADTHQDELSFIQDNLYKSPGQTNSAPVVPTQKQLQANAQEQTNFLRKRAGMMEALQRESEIEVVDLEGTYFGPRRGGANSDAVSSAMAAPRRRSASEVPRTQPTKPTAPAAEVVDQELEQQDPSVLPSSNHQFSFPGEDDFEF